MAYTVCGLLEVQLAEPSYQGRLASTVGDYCLDSAQAPTPIIRFTRHKWGPISNLDTEGVASSVSSAT